MKSITLYILVSAVVSYAIRVIPLTLFRKPIKSRFIRSFLYYVPYVTIAVMTFPAILYATGSMISAVAGFIAAVILSYRRGSLIVVAAGACGTVLLAELLLTVI